MKRFLLLLTLCIFWAFPGTVSAHQLKVDRNIGVTVHIDPDDAPTAAVPSRIFVEITDKTGRFPVNNPENCNCRIRILQDATMLQELPFVVGGRYTNVTYAFPQPGIYAVEITGKPDGKGRAFQEFSAKFEYFVSGTTGTRNSSVQTNPLQGWVPVAAAAAGIMLVLLFVL